MSINSIIFQSAAIGDYLFLIMIVVASIIQSISQNRKKKALQEMTQKKNTQGNTSMPDVLEAEPETMKGYDSPVGNIFESIQKMLIPEFEEEKHVLDDDFPVTVAEKKIIKETDQTPVNAEEKLMREIDERHKELVTPKPVTDIPAISRKTRMREGFNLRKAVVYSEILNRKYT